MKPSSKSVYDRHTEKVITVTLARACALRVNKGMRAMPTLSHLLPHLVFLYTLILNQKSQLYSNTMLSGVGVSL